MNPLQNSYDKGIDSYIETNTEKKGKVRLIHENLLKRLPPDILREMARRRLVEIKAAGYDVPEPVYADKAAATYKKKRI